MKRNHEIVSLMKLALPVATAHLAHMSMQIVDTMFVGRVSAEAIGAVSVGNAVFAVFMVMGIGLSLGLDFIISHAFGAGKQDECNRSLIQSIYLCTFVSIPGIGVMYLASGLFEWFGIEPQVAILAKGYLRILSWSLWLVLMFNAFRQYLQAMGVANAVMVIMVLANVLNIAANWVFVFGKLGFPALGVEGSGLATLLSRVFMLLAILAYVARRDKKYSLGLLATSMEFSRTRMMRIVELGLPAMGQVMLEVGVFALATLLAGKLGSTVLAAHQIALHIASLTFMVGMGVSAAAAVRIGSALGHGNQDQAIKTGWTAVVCVALLMGVFAILMFALREPLMGLFTSDPLVIEAGKGLLILAAFFQLFDGTQVVGAGILRGIGETRASMFANLVGHWFVGLPLGIGLCFGLGLGAQGLWIGLSTGLIFVSLALMMVWRKKVRRMRATSFALEPRLSR
ncbi:MAG: MATE family efflux transporter [Bdellovibrionota bacterium]